MMVPGCSLVGAYPAVWSGSPFDGPVDHVTGAVMGSEQSQYPVAQGWVAGAFAFQIRSTFLGRQRHGGGEEGFDAIGGLGHGLVLRSRLASLR